MAETKRGARGEDSIYYDGYRIMVRHLTALVGNVKLVELNVKLVELTVRDVDFALGQLAKRFSTRSVRLAPMILIQAIRNAMAAALTGEKRDGPPGHSKRSRLVPCWTQPRENGYGHIVLGLLLASKRNAEARAELRLQTP